MQAAVQCLPGERRARRGQRQAPRPSLVVADDSALLDALPIAAAVVAKSAQGALEVIAHNGRFKDTVDQSTCTAVDWNDADCLKDGPIAELIRAYFDGS